MSSSIASRIDHTLLRADARRTEIDTLCDEAREFGFAAVCVHPIHIVQCVERLRGCEVAICTVLSFPHGCDRPGAIAAAARDAIEAGATELDVVAAYGRLLDGDERGFADGLRAAVAAARESSERGSVRVKAILETAALGPAETERAAELALEAGVDFLKTSTGFGPGGATVEAVRTLRRIAGDRAQVKASGGVRDLASAREMIAAGADRIGASAGVSIARAESSA